MNKNLIGMITLVLIASLLIAGCTTSTTPSNQTANTTTKSATATANATQTTNATTSSNATQGTQMVVNRGQDFTIRLRSNPSTGYRWQVNYDSNYVSLVNQTFQSDPHPSGMVGVGGYDVYVFNALKTGTTTIGFDNISPAQQVVNSTTYTIVIV